MSNSVPGNRAQRSDGFVHVRLTGPVVARAYIIGNAVRLGNLTLVVADAAAARSIALLGLLMDDVSHRLNYAYVGREVEKRSPTAVTALVELHGHQVLSDFTITPSRVAVDRCGEASVTVGSFRISVRDRDAADAVSRALIGAYEEARHQHVGLVPFEEFKAARDNRRNINKRRRGQRV